MTMDPKDTPATAVSDEGAAVSIEVHRARVTRLLDVLAATALGDYSARISGIEGESEDEFLELEVAANMLLDELQLTRQQHEAQQLEIVRQSERLRLQQEELVRALSTPIIVVAAGVLAMPVIGAVEAERAQNMTEALLARVVAERSTHVILDLTGAGEISPTTAQSLLRMTQAMRLLGTRPLLTGISPAMAQTLVALNFDISQLATLPQLADALALVLAEKSGMRAGNGDLSSALRPPTLARKKHADRDSSRKDP